MSKASKSGFAALQRRYADAQAREETYYADAATTGPLFVVRRRPTATRRAR
jgi:hypothetical protein